MLGMSHICVIRVIIYSLWTTLIFIDLEHICCNTFQNIVYVNYERATYMIHHVQHVLCSLRTYGTHVGGY